MSKRLDYLGRPIPWWKCLFGHRFGDAGTISMFYAASGDPTTRVYCRRCGQPFTMDEYRRVSS